MPAPARASVVRAVEACLQIYLQAYISSSPDCQQSDISIVSLRLVRGYNDRKETAKSFGVDGVDGRELKAATRMHHMNFRWRKTTTSLTNCND